MSDEPDDFDWDAYHKEANSYFEALDYALDRIKSLEEPKVEIPRAIVIRPNFLRRLWRQLTKG